MGESNGIGRKWSLSPSGACADVLRASFTAKKIKKIGKNNYFFKSYFTRSTHLIRVWNF